MPRVLKFLSGREPETDTLQGSVGSDYRQEIKQMLGGGADDAIVGQRCYHIQRGAFTLNFFVDKHPSNGSVLYALAEYVGERDDELSEFVVDFDRLLTLHAAVALKGAADVYYTDSNRDVMIWRAPCELMALDFQTGIVCGLEYARDARDQIQSIKTEAKAKAREQYRFYKDPRNHMQPMRWL